MAKAGNVIENPITGEKIVFRKIASDTNGKYVELDLFVQPGGFVSAEHIHRGQEERFEVLAGSLSITASGQTQIVKQGSDYTVKAGTPHSWVNHGKDELHIRLTFTPALQVEQFFEVLFGLVNDGKTNKRGMPNLLHLAILARKYNIWLPKIPFFVQNVLFGIFELFGSLMGYKRQHSTYIKGSVKAG